MMEVSKFLADNSKTIEKELNWLSALIDRRLNDFFSTDKNIIAEEIKSPNLEYDTSNLARFIKTELKDDLERLLIISALSTNLFPEVYDRFLIKNKVIDKTFTEFGGIKDSDRNNFVPTLRTIVFIMNGMSIEHKIKIKSYFSFDHIFKIIS